MKAIVALDDSQCSRHAVDNVCRRQWPPGSELELLTVLHSTIPFIPDLTFMLVAAHEDDLQLQINAAPYLLEEATRRIRAACPGLRVTSRIAEGSPPEAIVAEAERCGADVIIVGSHGRGAMRRLLLGSVSDAVARHAPCEVQVVRPPLLAR